MKKINQNYFDKLLDALDYPLLQPIITDKEFDLLGFKKNYQSIEFKDIGTIYFYPDTESCMIETYSDIEDSKSVQVDSLEEGLVTLLREHDENRFTSLIVDNSENHDNSSIYEAIASLNTLTEIEGITLTIDDDITSQHTLEIKDTKFGLNQLYISQKGLDCHFDNPMDVIYNSADGEIKDMPYEYVVLKGILDLKKEQTVHSLKSLNKTMNRYKLRPKQ